MDPVSQVRVRVDDQEEALRIDLIKMCSKERRERLNCLVHKIQDRLVLGEEEGIVFMVRLS